MSINQYAGQVARLTKELSELEKREARELERVRKARGEAAKYRSEASKTKSDSTRASKLRQADSKEREAERAQGEIARVESRKAAKLKELERAKENLRRAETSVSKRKDTEDKKRRREEVEHSRRMRQESERTIRLRKSAAQLPTPPPKITVVVVSANPLDTDPLRLDEEVREITKKIRLSEYRDSVELVSRWAARPLDLLQILNEDKPTVIHFSGHGADTGELVFQSEDGESKFVSTDAIGAAISTTADDIRLVVLNTCHSAVQAGKLVEHVDVAIGMGGAIGDEAARVFSSHLYSAIGFGKSVRTAFDQAVTALKLEGIPEDSRPRLFAREGLDPRAVVLVAPGQPE